MDIEELSKEIKKCYLKLKANNFYLDLNKRRKF